MTRQIPPSLWEKALVKHYLDAEGPGGSGPIRYLDARPEELAKAIKAYNGTRVSPEEARSQFSNSFDLDELRSLFGSGRKPLPSTPTVPGYFRHLLLTCMVPAIDDEADTKNFRARLGHEVVARGASLGSLDHLPELWADLVRWIEKQKAHGHGLRSLILPDQGTWTIIGYSQKLAFPSWRDRNAMRHLVARSSIRTAGVLIDCVSDHIADRGGAGSLKSVFEDFRIRYRSGERMLRRHPFWILAQEALAESVEAAGDMLAEALIVELREGLDQDLEFLLRAPNSDAPIRTGDFATIEAFFKTGITVPLRHSAERLRAVLDRGWLALERIGLGVWASDPSTQPRDFVRIVASEAGKRLWVGARISWTQAGLGWSVSSQIDPCDPGVSSIIGWTPIERGELVREVELFGGTRLENGAYLGRLGTLPFIRAPENADIRLVPLEPGLPNAWIDHCAAATEFEIMADRPLSGKWDLTVREKVALDTGPCEDPRRIRFEPVARIHNYSSGKMVRVPESDPEIIVNRPGCAGFAPTASCRLPSAVGAPMDRRVLDIGEMVYAKGRSGISEYQLLPALRRIVPRNGPSVWDVLRAYHEAGWLEVRLRPGWGTREWFLRSPGLMRVAGRGFVVDGSMPYRRIDELRITCRRAGVELLERPSPSPWAPPLLHIDDEARGAEVARELEWPIIEAEWPALDPAPRCWPSTMYETLGRHAATVWSWDQGRFIWPDGLTHNRHQVQLVRWTRERRDAADIFVVSGTVEGDMVTESRTAAILEAHRRAQLPLFEFDGFRLRRQANDGFLPLPIARALRWCVLTDSGPEPISDGRFEYCYRVPAEVAVRLSAILGLALRITTERRRDFDRARNLALRRTPKGRYVRSRPNFL